MQDAQQLAHDGARRVRVRLQSIERDGGNDGKKDLRADPDDESEMKEACEAKSSLRKDTGAGNECERM